MTSARRPEISLFYSLLTVIGRRAVRLGLYPPPQSPSPLESAICLAQAARIWRDKRDSARQPENQVHCNDTASFPNSLNATAAVPFLNGNGPQVPVRTTTRGGPDELSLLNSK